MCSEIATVESVAQEVADSASKAGIFGWRRRERHGEQKQDTVKKAGKASIALVLKPFEVRALLADNHVCGGYDGTFTASCSMVVDSLDGSGFVTDNLSFIEEVRSRFGHQMLKASCEELALGVAHIAYERVGTRLLEVTVQVFNLTGHAEVTWIQGNAKPEFPRVATRRERRDTFDARERREPARSC